MEHSQQTWLQCFCDKCVRAVGPRAAALLTEPQFHRDLLSPLRGSIQFLLSKPWKERMLGGCSPASLGVEIGILL